jgi:hypothetical protein
MRADLRSFEPLALIAQKASSVNAAQPFASLACSARCKRRNASMIAVSAADRVA